MRACLAMLLLVLLSSDATAHRPNVIVILIDAWRADRFGPVAGRPELTPFLYSLADRAYVFQRAYAPAADTPASIASFLTARYPARHGIRGFDAGLGPGVVTLPMALHDRGFATALFTSSVLFGGADAGVDTYRQVVQASNRVGAAETGAETIRWLNARTPEDDRPVFLLVHDADLRPPYQPPPAYMQRVTGRFTRAQEAQNAETVRRANRLYFDGRQRPLTRGQVADLINVYDASVMAMDLQLRALFTLLERRSLLADAIVVVTASGGEDLLEHGDLRLPGTLWESRLHVPLLLLVPGKTTRTDVTEPVSLVDVAPTLLALLGLPIPPGFEGRVLLPLMRRAEFPRSVDSLRWRVARWWRGFEEPVYAEVSIRHGAARPAHRRALVLGTHKLLVSDNGIRAYFDLERDPNEANPRALGSADRKRLDRALDDLQERFLGDRPMTSPRTLTPADLAQLRAHGDLDE